MHLDDRKYMVINVCTLPNALRLDTFTKLIAYKKYMSGGNFVIAAAYVQLVTLFYETLENKEEFKEQMHSACKLFVSTMAGLTSFNHTCCVSLNVLKQKISRYSSTHHKQVFRPFFHFFNCDTKFRIM